MSMIRGISQRIGLRKKDDGDNNNNGNGNNNSSGNSGVGGSRIAGSGVSSVSPLETLMNNNNNTNSNNTTTTNNASSSTSPRKNTARPPVPSTAAPTMTSSMRAASTVDMNTTNSTTTTTNSTAVPFQQRLVYAVMPPTTATTNSPPAPRSNPPVKASSEELAIEFDDDDDDDATSAAAPLSHSPAAKRSQQQQRPHPRSSSDSSDDDDDDDDDSNNAANDRIGVDTPPPADPLSPPEQEFDDDDDESGGDDAILFADDRDEFAEEPLPPVPSEPNPSVRSPPPPPSIANPQKQLVDELLDSDSHPLLAASAPSLTKFTSVRSSGESTAPLQRERTLTRTTREKMLAPTSVSMRRSPPPGPLQAAPSSPKVSVSERTALFGGPGVGGPAAASFAAAAAAQSRAGAAPVRAKDLNAPGLLKSVSEPASSRSAQQKTGWLVKKGKKRWFLLRGNVLYWFSKEVDPMADIGKGVNNYLQLAGCAVEATDSPRFSVRIAPPPGPKSKPYVLTAQDEATRARWMRSLVIAAAVRDESSVVTSGYMLKKGKRRFFVIEDDQLKWYLSSKMGKTEFKGCLQLATCRLSGVTASDSVILESTSAAKSYELITSSPDEYKHWMNALETSIQHAQRSWRQRHGSSTLRAGGIASDVVGDGGGTQRAAPAAYWSFQIEQTIPVTAADGGTFTTYMVDVTAPNGAQRAVLKRYRQFDDLDAALRRHSSDRALPSLPTKKLVGNMNPQFVRNRCLGLQRYLNQVAQLPGINELPEFIYFVTEHAAADGWHDSVPLQPADVLQRWAWIDEHRAAATPPPPLVDAACVQGGLRIEIGCTERPPWLAQATPAASASAATADGGARSPRGARGATTSAAAAAVTNAADDDEHDVNLMVEEAIDRDVLYYRTFFAGRAHDNYVSPTDTELGPVALTIDGEGVAITSTSRVYKVLLRTKRGDRRYSLTSARARGERLKELRAKLGLGDLPLTRVRAEDSEARFVEYERKLLVTRYKFGVLRVAAGQKGEDEIYANTEMTAPFERFLTVLGDRITLLGFDGYTGGLNTRDGSTGEHSVYCKIHNFEVMFHIAPMLPFFEDDKQQVERKRHLGNDVVLVIFLESNASEFDPRILTSHFNSAFVVVRPVGDSAYDVAVVYRSDVRPVRPFFSTSGAVARLSGTRDEMHTALVTKLVNLERAAMSSGEFVGLDMRTRNLMLGDICNTLREK